MKKTALITGTSKGIGLALKNIFLNNGYIVIGTCRNSKDDKSLDPNYQVVSLDLASFESINECSRAIEKIDPRIDLLINNAGIGPDLDYSYPEQDSFSRTFDVNVTGTTFFTEQMLKYINKGGKIINVSSKMGSIDVCQLTDSVAYRMSKAALNMYTKILANRLTGQQSVAAIHPGWVRTTIAKSNINGRLSPEESAARIYDFAISEFRSGIFWNVETGSECNW